MDSRQVFSGNSAYVIGFCNSKGGPGKTTLALNATVELFDQGRRVAFIDAEEYGPNAEALNGYDDRIATRSETTTLGIDDALEELKQHHDIIILDSPGKTSGDEVATICALADLVIVPMKTSRKDIRQTKPVLRMIKHCQLRQSGNPDMVIVFNETREKSIAARAYRKQFTEAGFHVADAEIRAYDYHRDNDFVTRNPDAKQNGDKCAQDIFNLVYEVIQPRLRVQQVAANE